MRIYYMPCSIVNKYKKNHVEVIEEKTTDGLGGKRLFSVGGVVTFHFDSGSTVTS